MSQPLTLKLLGGLAIEIDDQPVSGLVTQKAEVLLAYLACHPRPHSRELLATMLWDDRTQKQALSNLRTLLTSLRRHLKPYLSITRQTVSLNDKATVWVDAAAMVQALANVLEITAQDQEPAEEHLLDYLRQREMLLVLDNFEQLVTEGLELVQTILSVVDAQRTPSLDKVIATILSEE